MTATTQRHRCRGTTLLELMLALVVVAIVGSAAASLLLASANTSKYITASGDAVWQIDNAERRMAFNLRAASTLDAPTTTTATNTFTIHTQPDSSNGNTTYQVSYALSGTNLQETDTRYGTNTIAQNVTAFNVTRLSVASPVTVQVTITIGTKPAITRTFVILCRNL